MPALFRNLRPNIDENRGLRVPLRDGYEHIRDHCEAADAETEVGIVLVDICEVQELLGHKNVTTTQIYDKRVRQTKDSASHKLSY